MSFKKSANAYRNIREASEELELEAHVLRFWESRFDKLTPMTRGGGRRFYSVEDMELLRTIKHLLHDQGHTIKAANRMITEGNVQAPVFAPTPSQPPTDIAKLSEILNRLIASARQDIARMDVLLN